MKYLRIMAPYASDIYHLVLVEVDSKNPIASDSNYFLCYIQNKQYFEKMLKDIRLVLSNCCSKPFVPGKKYWYITTTYASHFKKMHVTYDENVNNANNEFNYFDTQEMSENTLQKIKDVFQKYGVNLATNKVVIY